MNIHLKHYKYFIAFFTALFLFAGRPIEFGQELNYFQGYSIQKPAIRVGLSVNLSRIVIRSSSGMKIYRQDSDFSLIGQDVTEAQVKGFREKLSEKFLIQVGPSLRNEDAQELARRLQSSTGYSVAVTEDRDNPLAGRHQVRLGDFLTRGDALAFFPQLNRLGHMDLWIVREEVSEKESHPLWVLVNDQLIPLAGSTMVYFIPGHPESYLTYEGKDYRGLLAVKNSPRGVVLINILNLDEYLKGVVPSELSPLRYRELEALKAQAVAARTYALKNMGRYEHLGFDLDDTQSSQVYGGLSIEHPLSSRAVDLTRGLVARYDGQLINALYTSTCGGLTENAENVFEGNPVPYLQSEECTTELRPSWTLRSAASARPVVWRGRDVSREAASLAALGILADWGEAPAALRAPLTPKEAAQWLVRALSLFGRKREIAVLPGASLTAAALAGLVVESFQWRDRVKNLMLRKEADLVMRSANQIGDADREAAAYLSLSGFFPPGLDPADETHALTRAEAALVLYRLLTSEQPLLQDGEFQKLDRGRMFVAQGDSQRSWEIASRTYLFRSIGGEPMPATELELEPGDRLRFLEKDGAVGLVESVSDEESPVLDKSSRYNRWQVRLRHDEVEKRVNDYYPVGRLVDIVPWKRGASRRVTELLLAGNEAQVTVRGLKVRWVLGLRDTLFTVDREYDEEGLLRHFVFTGRGWGHGVGLCQVGAHRMAQLGVRFEAILKKYYRGITIDKIY